MQKKQWWDEDLRIASRGHRILDAGGTSERKARLFADECFRRVRDRLQSDAAARAVELSLDYAEGRLGDAEFLAACALLNFSDLDDRFYRQTPPALSKLAYDACVAASHMARPRLNIEHVTRIVEETLGSLADDYYFDPTRNRFWEGIFEGDEEAREATGHLLDIFGHLIHGTAFDPAWRTDDAVGVALQMYDTRDFRAMPILADALEDAGCTDPEILGHCRSPGVHVRGCWVVDRVLGRE